MTDQRKYEIHSAKIAYSETIDTKFYPTELIK